MAYLSLSAVEDAIITLLNVTGLTSLATLTGDPAQGGSFPLVWPEVQERDVRGFGTGGLPEVTVRVHTFSTYEGSKEAQAITQKVIELLRDQLLTVVGYNSCGRIFYDETVDLPDEALNGIKVREQVAVFRCYVEEPF